MAYNTTLTYRIAHNLCIDCSKELPTGWTRRRCEECGEKRCQYQSVRHGGRATRGLCRFCGVPVPSIKRLCDECVGKNSIYLKRAREKRIAKGVCTACGKQAPLESMARNQLCEACYFRKVSRYHFGTHKYWQFLQQKLEEQDYRCPYTGELLVLGVNDSLDHIYPKVRYPELAQDLNNVEWVTRTVNEMKRDRTPEEFLALMRHIIAYREGKTDGLAK